MNERNNQGVRVAINHVSKDFPVDNGRMNVLNDIDMEIKPGEFISIVGSSGCGKSTLLKILGGLQSPTEGEAYVRRKHRFWNSQKNAERCEGTVDSRTYKNGRTGRI